MLHCRRWLDGDAHRAVSDRLWWKGQLKNSVKNIVAVKNNRIASSKKSDAIHGTGLKSIKRVVKKYDGEINMKFNEDDMTFTSNIVFEILR